LVDGESEPTSGAGEAKLAGTAFVRRFNELCIIEGGEDNEYKQ
jgi:hypothetical protein